MTSLHRAVRPTPNFTVVKVRRIKHRIPTPVGPRPRGEVNQDPPA
ncbi:hypothetical protein [Phenylobacterium soli]|nr:hypothetical protein [Phenylobacterium soli]